MRFIMNWYETKKKHFIRLLFNGRCIEETDTAERLALKNLTRLHAEIISPIHLVVRDILSKIANILRVLLFVAFSNPL